MESCDNLNEISEQIYCHKYHTEMVFPLNDFSYDNLDNISEQI